MQSVVKNHALIDGNKRLGWLSIAVFLELNSVAAHHAPNNEVYEFVNGIAAGARRTRQIAEGSECSWADLQDWVPLDAAPQPAPRHRP
jgi:prophage maintenance system killer protein